MKINHIVDEDITRRGFLQGAGAAAVAGAAGSAMAQLSPDEKAKYLKYLQQDVDRYQREYIRKKEWEEEQAKRDDAMRKKGIDPYKVTDSQSLRQSNLDRMKQMVEPLSASYAERIIARIRPNILFTSEIEGNPVAEVEMRCAPDGTILGRKIIKSSGNAEWDQAVIKAIDKSERIPRDVDGKVPLPIVISFRPKDISTKESVNQGMEEAVRPPIAPDPQNYDSDVDYYNDRDADPTPPDTDADYENMDDAESDDWFDESKEKVGNMDADAFDAALSRMKKLAGAGPLRTVYDPARRVYKNVPHAVQPAQQPKKSR